MAGHALSLCLIARDSATTLRGCLASIRPWVDELIVVDTGSVDDTPEIARSYGAQVYYFPWCDDFSAARNESLRLAHGDWLFWMDSDDTIDVENGKKLQALVRSSHQPGVLGYVLQVVCPGESTNGETDCTIVDHVKVFRNLPELRFQGRIHEQILPSIRRLGGEIGWTDIRVIHSGSDQSPAGRKKKQDRDLRILRLELESDPEHPFTLFNLGMTFGDMEDHQSAIQFLRRSIHASDDGDSHLRKAYSLLVHSLIQSKDLQAAGQACDEGRARFPNDPELLFRHATLAHAAKNWQEAELSYKSLLEPTTDRYLSSMDPTITGYKARHNLAAVYQDMGQPLLAEQQWRQVVREMPLYVPGWRGLLELLLLARRMQTAAVEIEHTLSVPDLRPLALLMRAKWHESQRAFAEAHEDLLTARRESPDSTIALEARCRFLFEHGDPWEAKRSLEELAERTPEDGAVFHNLGAVLMRLGLADESVEAYRRSLALRPDSEATIRELGFALSAAGRANEAE